MRVSGLTRSPIDVQLHAKLSSLSDSGLFGCNGAREQESERPIFHRFFLTYSRYAPQNRQNLYSLSYRFAIEHLNPTGY